jgi:nucleoside-diphosphate-sugar epimerase
MSIYLTGASGFVGKNLISYLGESVVINKYTRGSEIIIQEDIVIHLAGKAHDLKKVASDNEYYLVNTDLTKDVFNAFLASDAKVFIFLSSVKAVADEVKEILTEDFIPNPITHYGKSKLLAEQYILSKPIPIGKRIYILRPCMIHGPGNKGNLNLLYNFVSKGLPWPLGAFENKRSFCSIDNLCFVIGELIENDQIPGGVYNVADDIPLSTNQIIMMIAESKGKKVKIFNCRKSLIIKFARIGNFLNLPFNMFRLQKLTENYITDSNKLLSVIGKRMPISSKEGLMKTFHYFNNY